MLQWMDWVAAIPEEAKDVMMDFGFGTGTPLMLEVRMRETSGWLESTFPEVNSLEVCDELPPDEEESRLMKKMNLNMANKVQP